MMAWKAMVGVLSVGSAQTLISVPGGSAYELDFINPSGLCNSSALFSTMGLLSVFKPGEAPYSIDVPPTGILGNYSEGDFLYNSGDRSVLLNFNGNCTYESNNAYKPTSFGISTCIKINEKTDVNCTLYQAPSNLTPGGAEVTLITKDYAPSAQGAPVDLNIFLTPSIPFNILYSSDRESTMEVIGISDIDPPQPMQGTVFMACMQQKRNESSASHAHP